MIVKQNETITLFNPISGEVYDSKNTLCPLTNVFFVFDAKNVKIVAHSYFIDLCKYSATRRALENKVELFGFKMLETILHPIVFFTNTIRFFTTSKS